MITVILIALVVCAVVAWMMYGSADPPDEEREERYCLKCGKVTWWHPVKGCEHCAWCERQW